MKNLRLFFFAFLLPIFAYGQGVFIPARTVTGTVNGAMRPISGAAVTVCGPNSPGIPCSPALANTVFQNSALNVPLSNPFFTDANGNYPQAALAGGVYTITESAAGFTGFSYQATVSCAPGAPCTVTTFNATTATISGALMAATLTPSIHSDRQPFVDNPDFEIGSAIPPIGWQIAGVPGLNANVVVSYETSTQAPGKTQSIKLTTTALAAGISQIRRVAVLPGDVYAVSAMGKGDGTGQPEVDFVFLDKNGNNIGGAGAASSSTSWVQIGTTAVAPVNAVSGQLTLFNDSSPASTVWLDQVRVQDLTGTVFLAGGTPDFGSTNVNGAVTTVQTLGGACAVTCYAIGQLNVQNRIFDVEFDGTFNPVNNTETVALSLSLTGVFNTVQSFVPVTAGVTGLWSYHLTCVVSVPGTSGTITCSGTALTSDGGGKIFYSIGAPASFTGINLTTTAVNPTAGISFTTASASNAGGQYFAISHQQN